MQISIRARHRKDILLPEEGLRFDCAPVELYPRQERALVSFHSATTGPRGSDDGQNYCGDRISVRPMSAINKQPVIWCVVGRLPGIIHRQRIIEVVDRILFFPPRAQEAQASITELPNSSELLLTSKCSRILLPPTHTSRCFASLGSLGDFAANFSPTPTLFTARGSSRHSSNACRKHVAISHDSKGIFGMSRSRSPHACLI